MKSQDEAQEKATKYIRVYPSTHEYIQKWIKRIIVRRGERKPTAAELLERVVPQGK